MRLDPQIVGLLDQLKGLPALEESTPLEVRALTAALTPPPATDPAGGVSDCFVQTSRGPLNARLYRPAENADGLIVYFHGGGWVSGSLDSCDALLREFCLQTGCCVLSVAYRLAPEDPFPAAVEDAVDAVCWADDSIVELAGGQVPIFVGGDSAGANRATVSAIVCRDTGGPSLAGQLLFYPVTDADFTTGSYGEFAEGMFLTRNLMQWFWHHYLPDVERRADFRASPLRAADLSRLPPALVQTAEFDPLRDEGEAYALRLSCAGGEVELQRRLGLIHGYIAMGAVVRAAQQAIDEAAFWVRSRVSDIKGVVHD